MASQLFTIRLTREDTSVPWGFRLEGGTDIGHPINIQRVVPQSIAEFSGLRAGDQVVRINRSETSWMRHDDAKMEIVRSNNDLELLVDRGGAHMIRSTAPVTMMPTTQWNKPSPTPKAQPVSQAVWQPKIVANPSRSMPGELDTHINLEANNQTYDEGIGVRHNVSPTPFGQAPPAPGQTLVTHGSDGRIRQIKQISYNSPAGLYAKRNVDETFERTISTVSGLTNRPGVAHRPQGGAGVKTDTSTKFCAACGEMIRDVFVKVQGRVPMHPECLKCCKCGVGLRNVGYFYINDQLYCERHAKQAAPPPEPGMKPVVVYK
ncbi:unnamed protein product [Calicophoron daubneyi]|uniref:PDZ and LIM domain protein Zasp n=1 Tax=Calicophoron daubneyi TaxID=300641 RepID=A0AAV2TRZ8_CALDB